MAPTCSGSSINPIKNGGFERANDNTWKVNGVHGNIRQSSDQIITPRTGVGAYQLTYKLESGENRTDTISLSLENLYRVKVYYRVPTLTSGIICYMTIFTSEAELAVIPVVWTVMKYSLMESEFVPLSSDESLTFDTTCVSSRK